MLQVVVSRKTRRHAPVWWALVCLIAAAAAAAPLAQRVERPIVMLIAIDGWRWDYIDRFSPPVLTQLATSGVRAEGLIPVFPSKTFPNHYSIVTGLYPGKHGIVSNTMIDPTIPGARFRLGDAAVQQDTRWWGGEPIWVTVERQGQIAGTMFWPGSDVSIAGDRPTYYRPYQHDLPNHERVSEVLSWLRRPHETRPTFLTLYFSDLDSAGHDFGPDSPQVADAAARVDATLAKLMAGVAETGLASVVNYLIVSDHGMSALSRERTIVIDDYVDPAAIDIIDSSPVLGIAPRDGNVDAVYRALNGRHRALTVYKREELPAFYGLANHRRVPPIVAIADDGWHITTRAALQREKSRFPAGSHGYDPRFRSMHGLFVAAGPAFRSGVIVPAFENVHVYELICRVLGVRPAPNDGDPRMTERMLRTP